MTIRKSMHILCGSSIRVVLGLISENKSKLKIDQFIKLVIILVITFVHSPFAFIEKRIYNKRIRSTVIKSPIFILGYPRSGTTNLIYLLSKDKQFAFCKTYEAMSPHVMLLMGPLLRWISSFVLPSKRPMDNMQMGPDLPIEEEFAIGNMCRESMAHGLYFPENLTEYLNKYIISPNLTNKTNWNNVHQYFLKKLTFKNKNKQLLLKSPFDTARIPEIVAIYPDAKFIHISRHPYAVFLSNKNLYQSIMPQLSIKSIPISHVIPQIIKTYKLVYERYITTRKMISNNNLIEIRYEDFIGKELEVLERIYKAFNLNGFEDMQKIYTKSLKANAGYAPNNYTNNSKEENEIRQEWEFAYSAFHYDQIEINPQ